MSVFPEELAGRSIDCVFDQFTPRLTYGPDGLRVQLSLPDAEIDEVVAADVRLVAPHVFAVNWTERNGNFIVQVQDHERKLVHNFARLASGENFAANGSIRSVER